MIERRVSPRRNTCFFRSFVYFENSTIAADCIVRDIPDSDGRLQFSAPQKFTEILDLFNPSKGQSFHATVRRQTATRSASHFMQAQGGLGRYH